MTLRLLFPVTLVAAALAAAPIPASAAILTYAGSFSGTQEVPPNASPGVGLASASFDTATNILSVQASFANLLSGTTVAHIHCCALPGANAGVATPTPTFPGFPTGVTSGNYAASFDLTLASSFNPAFVTNNGGTVDGARAAFLAGLAGGRAYFNIHSGQFPGGEIRAQLAAVPEPGSWLLMLAGFGAIGGSLRYRRRAAARLA